ncbi:MAG TPA: glycosyltransferase family 1 protein [Rhodocyclaceae bacterium]|nr:glycosyltransferase family 1 protein [Rhodocyclaceae bacterium]
MRAEFQNLIESHPADSLRVALVTETFAPEVNGVAMTLGRMVDGLRQRGHGVQLIRPRQHKTDAPPPQPGLEHVVVPGLPIPRYPGLRFGLPNGRTLQRLWAEKRPHIVHVATEGPLGWAALNTARRMGIPVSSTFHTNFDAYSRYYGIGWLRGGIMRYLRHFHNKANTTLVPTRRQADSLNENGFRNVGVLSRGVDTKLFTPARRSRSLRARWGLSGDELVVAYVGRIAPEKNLGLLIKAFDAIREKVPNARLLFVGDGPATAELRRRSDSRSPYLFVGMRHGEDLAEHYACADLFLFPSLTETFGNVTTEALASGLAVVAFDYGAAGELIRDRVNGCLVPNGASKRFIDTAVEVATNDELRRSLRHHAASSVAHLDWENIHNSFESALRSHISSPAGNPLDNTINSPTDTPASSQAQNA